VSKVTPKPFVTDQWRSGHQNSENFNLDPIINSLIGITVGIVTSRKTGTKS
jgi:hypothetical protein